VLSGYLAARILAWRPSSGLLAAYLIALTVAFVVLKRYAFLDLLPGDGWLMHAIDLVGLSFIFFRQIHYVVDVAQGDIKDVRLLTYLCYQLNPFTLLAGPIHRYQRFNEDWQTLTPLPADAHETRMAFFRILIGYLKVAVVAEICLGLAMDAPDALDALRTPITFYFYPAYVFFNFAGYCDIVIAGATLFGIRLPENFMRPYLARNMIDYWTRWHRSLTFWIRDYVFTPLYMSVARPWPKLAPHLVFVCYFVALFLAGAWHGSTWNFLVFGVLNGIGVSAAKLWENVIVAYAGRKGLRAYVDSKPILWLARFGTFNFACLTMVFLPPDSTDRLIRLWDKLLDVATRLIG
jgi:D-alanyl-lipoteichoic acid acyltransferase DltB (MBOAT superfamily)